MKNHQLLKTALTSNAIFSIISGLSLIFFNQQFQAWFEMIIPFWLIGLGLLPFGLMAFQASRDHQNIVKRGQIITLMDIFWVIGSIILLLIMDFTTIGQWLIIIVALIVGDFAFFQWLGMKRVKDQNS